MSLKYWCTFLQNVITLHYPISHLSSSEAQNNFTSNSHLLQTHSYKCILRGVLLTSQENKWQKEIEDPLILCFLFENNCFNPSMKKKVKLKALKC